MIMEEWHNRGKDVSPEVTVANIKAILDKAGIHTDYQPVKTTLAGCCSARVTVSDIPEDLIGANGKGVGESYCMASAYAELIERLQNKIFTAAPAWTDDAIIRELQDIAPKPIYTPTGAYQPECIQRLKAQLAAGVKNCPPWMKPIDLVNSMLEKMAKPALGNGYEMDSYYSVREKQAVLLPTPLLQLFTASNGMASGNSLEEAIVQAMSEIFERYATMKYVHCEYTPPRIPQEWLRRYKRVYRIIEEIESTGNYRVIVCDCSMGIGLPVVVGIIIDTRNHTFGVRFGAHPNMEVALERIFTEAMQGIPLERFARNNHVVLKKAMLDRVNTFNLMKIGVGGFPLTVLTEEPDYAFEPWEEPGTDNLVMAKKLLAKAAELGADVYICDNSFLGFPTVLIYAQGLSEVMDVDFLSLKEICHSRKCRDLFDHLNDLKEADVKALLLEATLKRGAYLENNVRVMSQRPQVSGACPAPLLAGVLHALCLAALGDNAAAAAEFQHLAGSSQDPDGAFSSCAHLILEAKEVGLRSEQIQSLVQELYPGAWGEQMMDIFADPAQILAKSYPLCNGRECGTCSNSACLYPQICDFYRLLARMEAANMPDARKLCELFA